MDAKPSCACIFNFVILFLSFETSQVISSSNLSLLLLKDSGNFEWLPDLGFVFFVFFLAMLRGMRDLSSLTRD